MYDVGDATAVGTCTDCDHKYRTPVEVTVGPSHAWVRCRECGHINSCESFES